MEVRERQETGNIREEISREFPLNLWTDEEARRVGEFLLGRAGEVKTVPDGALGVEPAKIEEGKLVTFAESLLSGTKAAKPVEPADQFGLIETAAEHRYVNIEMARTAIRVTLAAMEKQGLLRDVVVRFQGRGGMRLRDKKAYSYESVKGEEFDPLKYPWLDPSLYGRWVNLYVRAPVFEYEGEGGVKRQRRFGNERLRNSIGHEVGHLVRDVMGAWCGKGYRSKRRRDLVFFRVRISRGLIK